MKYQRVGLAPLDFNHSQMPAVDKSLDGRNVKKETPFFGSILRQYRCMDVERTRILFPRNCICTAEFPHPVLYERFRSSSESLHQTKQWEQGQLGN
jgi:hypothetical protein